MHFLRRIPRDPFSRYDGVAGETWGLRTPSPPTDPHSGDDVFDVYTLAQGRGSMEAYRDW